MSITNQLAKFTAAVDVDDLPSRVVALAKRQVVSMLGSAFAGMRARDVKRAARAIGPRPPSSDAPGLAGLRATALPSSSVATLEDALWLNACASMVHDMDDYLLFGHTGHSAVFGALGVAEAMRRPGRDVVAAIVAANELAGRLGGALSIGPQNGQMWSSIHSLGGAAATARVLGLDATATRHAIAIALFQPPFALYPGFMGPGSKITTAADPLRASVRAAFLAREGVTGAPEIFEGPKGLLERFPFVPLPGFFSGLGGAWLTETLSFKSVPGCAYVGAPVRAACEALAALRAHKGADVGPEQIEKVTVDATMLTVLMDRLSRHAVAEVARGGKDAPQLTPVVVNFSSPLSIAIALLDDGVLSPKGLDEERLERDREAILRFARRVEVRHDVERTRALLRELDRVFDVADLIARVPLAELSRAVRLLHSLHESRGLVEGIEEAVAFARGAAGRDLFGRIVGRRARAGLDRFVKSVARALDEAVPGGDAEHPPASHEPPPYDLRLKPVAGFRAYFGAAVELRMADGTQAHATCEIPPGASGREDDEGERVVRDRFLEHAVPVIGKGSAERALQLVASLETQPDVEPLARALRGG